MAFLFPLHGDPTTTASSSSINQRNTFYSATALQDYAALLDDELSVVRGQSLTVRYIDGPWAYATLDTQGGRRLCGFVPVRNLVVDGRVQERPVDCDGPVARPVRYKKMEKTHSQRKEKEMKEKKGFGTLLRKLKTTKHNRTMSSLELSDARVNQRSVTAKSTSDITAAESTTDITAFLKSLQRSNSLKSSQSGETVSSRRRFEGAENFELEEKGTYFSLYDYHYRYVDDLPCNLPAGAVVTMLNNTIDPEWAYVSFTDHTDAKHAGFVPRSYLVGPLAQEDIEALRLYSMEMKTNGQAATRLVAVVDFTPASLDDLPLQKGDALETSQAKLEKSGDMGWLWAYSCRLARYGYVQLHHVKHES